MKTQTSVRKAAQAAVIALACVGSAAFAGPRGGPGWGGPYHGGGHHHRSGGNGNAAAALVIGSVVGLIVGSAVASANQPVATQPVYPNAYAPPVGYDYYGNQVQYPYQAQPAVVYAAQPAPAPATQTVVVTGSTGQASAPVSDGQYEYIWVNGRQYSRPVR